MDFSTADTQVQYMMIDLRSLVKQRKIMKMLNVKNIHYSDPDDKPPYMLYFNRKEFAKTMKGMMN